jgi:hypothetical protein
MAASSVWATHGIDNKPNKAITLSTRRARRTLDIGVSPYYGVHAQVGEFAKILKNCDSNFRSSSSTRVAMQKEIPMVPFLGMTNTFTDD